MAEIGVHEMSHDHAGSWTEFDVDEAWRAVLARWPEDDARACRAIPLAIAAGLTPDEFLERVAAA